MAFELDRALRREIARLAMLEPDDLRAILEALEPGRRRRVEGLLAQLSEPDMPNPQGTKWPSWIEDRASGRIPGLTDRSRKALAACAERVVPNDAAPRRAAKPQSLVEQAFHALSRSGVRR
ncbi:MAG TPA: hypothetical protein VKQ27_09160 [Acetobacteraceae bacterium]|nr:hypothetical protein [Acetobacteraceae bacterium]